jgi:hypothetical protein
MNITHTTTNSNQGKFMIQIDPYDTNIQFSLPDKFKGITFKKNESLTNEDMDKIRKLKRNHSIPLLAYTFKTSQHHIKQIIAK